MGRSRHGIIGPDDPSISYKNNLFALVERVVQEYLDGFKPWKRVNRYIYVCNNPINFIDPLGLDFYATGSESNEGIKYISELTGLSLEVNDGGKVTIPEQERITEGTSEAASKMVIDAVNDHDSNITIQFDKNRGKIFGPGVLVGSITDEKGKRIVAMDHINALENAATNLGKTAIIHEVAEAHVEAKDIRKTLPEAHKEALEAENTVRKELGMDLRTGKDYTTDVKSGLLSSSFKHIIDQVKSTVEISAKHNTITGKNTITAVDVKPKEQNNVIQGASREPKSTKSGVEVKTPEL